MNVSNFVELPIGSMSEYNVINMNEVLRIEPDRNWTRLHFKNGESLLVPRSYIETIKLIKE